LQRKKQLILHSGFRWALESGHQVRCHKLLISPEVHYSLIPLFKWKIYCKFITEQKKRKKFVEEAKKQDSYFVFLSSAFTLYKFYILFFFLFFLLPSRSSLLSDAASNVQFFNEKKKTKIIQFLYIILWNGLDLSCFCAWFLVSTTTSRRKRKKKL
jgi:hypothetical protein